MLIDQIKTSEKCGEIEQLIYKAIYLSSKGAKSMVAVFPSKEATKYFKDQGFNVERLDYGIKISWNERY